MKRHTLQDLPEGTFRKMGGRRTGDQRILQGPGEWPEGQTGRKRSKSIMFFFKVERNPCLVREKLSEVIENEGV